MPKYINNTIWGNFEVKFPDKRECIYDRSSEEDFNIKCNSNKEIK